MARSSRQEKAAKKRRFKRRRVRAVGEPSALDLVEEGVHLLRRISLGYWSVYLLGAVPFLLGFLYFWAEMASSGLAEGILFPASIGMAGLFLWMKLTQVYFAHGLRSVMLGGDPEKWSLSTAVGVFLKQAFWQPLGLICLPITFVVTLPFPWAVAFFQNVMIDDPLKDREERSAAESWRLAKMWNEQNWMLLSLLSLVFFLLWLNFVTIIVMVPYLVKSLLGIETIFSRVGWNLFNSTTFFSCFMVSYLITDPLIKAVYLLRRHYCESRETGADLRLRLRRFDQARAASILLFGILAVGSFAPSSRALAEDVVSRPSISADALDASIDDVMQSREFVWRFPREVEMEEKKEHWLKSFIDKIEAFQERIEHWLEKWFDRDESKERDRPSLDGDFSGIADLISYILIGTFIVIVLYFAARAWRVYQGSEFAAVEDLEEEVAVPDLESDEVDASVLPRNRWIELARELISKGDYRLALRAYFLAQLSAFSSEGLILVKRAKSNREYADELSRRGHSRSDLLPLYRKQVRLFEGVWYGGQSASLDEISIMEAYLREQGVLT